MMADGVGRAPASAGAFNAPIGGTLFTLEEVTKSFRVKTVLAALFSAAAAVRVLPARVGKHSDFHVEPLALLHSHGYP